MSVKVYFGVPGSGKTTHAATVVYKNLKKGFPTFSNVPIVGAFLFDARSDLGYFDISCCDVIIDEASIDFNNRNYKALSQAVIRWMKYYRHHQVRDIYVYSQSYDDMDITLRRLSDRMYALRPLIPGRLFYSVQIAVKFGIDEQTHQPMNMYFLKKTSVKFFLGRPVWKMFDSWEVDRLPVKKFDAVGAPFSSYDFTSSGLKTFWRSYIRFRPLRSFLSSFKCTFKKIFSKKSSFK